MKRMTNTETMINAPQNNTRRYYKRSQKRLLFYVLMVALPVLQVAIFYLYVNINSFLLAFKNYTSYFEAEFAGLDNFKWAFERLGSSGSMFRNSFIKYLADLFLSLGLSIIFSYYLAKKYPAAGFFKTILFMPQILSAVVLTVLFRYIVNDVYMVIAGEELGLLDNPETALGTIVFFSIWVSFGSQVLMFTGAMSGIDDSVIEAAHLDGASVMQEFFYITMPMIWHTFVTYFVTTLAGIFTNQMNLYTFFGENAGELSTMGYYLYTSAKGSDVYMPGDVSYSQLSALGLVLTFIVLPLTLGSKKLLTKLGPSMD